LVGVTSAETAHFAVAKAHAMVLRLHTHAVSRCFRQSESQDFEHMHNFTKLVCGQAPQPGAYHNV